jgi:hypothetical protein
MANNLNKKNDCKTNNYNEKDLSESKINHRLKITNVFSLVN